MSDLTTQTEVQSVYYVYILFRPNGVPCYVGKGKGSRWLHHERPSKKRPNPNLARIINGAKGPLPKIKIREGLDSQSACLLEVALIKAIGRKKDGGPLVNLTDGGEGISGFSLSAETKAKLSAYPRTPAEKARLAALSKNRLGKKHSPKHCAAIAAANTGKIVSDEVRAKISAANKGRKHSAEAVARKRIVMGSDEVREKIRAARALQICSEETRAKMSASQTGRKHAPRSDVTREKCRISALERHAKARENKAPPT